MTFAVDFNDKSLDTRNRSNEMPDRETHGASPATLNVKPTMRRVGIVLFEGFSLLRAAATAEVFQLANESVPARSFSELSGLFYDVRMLSLAGGSLRAASSARMWTEPFEPEQYASFDALLIAAGNCTRSAALAQSLDGRMRSGYADAVPVRAACGGTLFGAQPPRGVPGHRAIRVVPSPPAFENEPISLDGTESVRSALALVKSDLGFDVAREIAERVMPGARAKLHHLLRDVSAKTVQERVCASARWFEENCERRIAVDEAVKVAVMSRRSFSRHFKLEFGMTPSEYLMRVRLDLVCRLLIETNLPVEKIARRCGIGSGDNLGKIFRKRLRSSPIEYRLRSRITL